MGSAEDSGVTETQHGERKEEGEDGVGQSWRGRHRPRVLTGVERDGQGRDTVGPALNVGEAEQAEGEAEEPDGHAEEVAAVLCDFVVVVEGIHDREVLIQANENL